MVWWTTAMVNSDLWRKLMTYWPNYMYVLHPYTITEGWIWSWQQDPKEDIWEVVGVR